MDIDALDPAIIAALPVGSQVVSLSLHGKTNWSTGLRVDVEVDGEEKEYFLKIMDRDEAVEMAQGEFECTKRIAEVIPNNVSPPIAWGPIGEDNKRAFFLTTFRNLRSRLPPLPQLLPIVVKMHQSNASISPNRKFGFPVPTFYGPMRMDNGWYDTWEEYFTREFRANLAYAQHSRGDDTEFADLAEEFVQKVLPRLLRPLETGGRIIRPTLCHGDLWDGNIQMDLDSKQPRFFDFSSFYGHHEMDFQEMGHPRYALGREFIDLYIKEVGASEPQEDLEDRLTLYSMRNDICGTGMWHEWGSLMPGVKTQMRRLLAKYPNGYDDFKPNKSM